MTCANMEQIILKTLREHQGSFRSKPLLWKAIIDIDVVTMNQCNKIFDEAFDNCLAKGLIIFRPGTNLVDITEQGILIIK